MASGLEDLGFYGGLIDVPPITLWDIASATEIRRIAGQLRGITSLAFSPDGKTLASSGGEPTPRLWDVATGREADHRPGHPGTIHSMVVSPADGSVFTSGNADGKLLHWDSSDGRLLEAVGIRPSMIDSLAISPDGRTLFVSEPGDGPVLWDVAGRRERMRLTLDRMEGGRNYRPALINGRTTAPRYFEAVFSPDGRMAVASGHVWDVVAGRLLVVLPASGSATFSADGRRIMTVDNDGVRTWDIASGAEVGRPIPGPLPGGWGAAFSPDGRLVALRTEAPHRPEPGSPATA